MDINFLRQFGQSTQILTLSDFVGNPTFRFELAIEENPDLERDTIFDDYHIFRYKFHNIEGDSTEISLLTENIEDLNDFTLEVADKDFLRTRALPLYLYVIARHLNRPYTISIPDLNIFVRVNPLQATQMTSNCPLELVYVTNWSEDKSNSQVEAEAKAFVEEMNYQLTMQD